MLHLYLLRTYTYGFPLLIYSGCSDDVFPWAKTADIELDTKYMVLRNNRILLCKTVSIYAMYSPT